MFDSFDDWGEFASRVADRLEGQPEQVQLAVALSACEHLRTLVKEVASVAPALDSALTTWWESDLLPSAVPIFDFDELERAVAQHTDISVADDVGALGLEANADLGLCLSILDQWRTAGDLSVLARIVSTIVGALDFAAYQSAEAATVMHTIERLIATGVSDLADERSQAKEHGIALARSVRIEWER